MKKKTPAENKRSIDFRKLSFASEPLCTKESMIGVIPVQWKKEVSSANKKVSIMHPCK